MGDQKGSRYRSSGFIGLRVQAEYLVGCNSRRDWMRGHRAPCDSFESPVNTPRNNDPSENGVQKRVDLARRTPFLQAGKSILGSHAAVSDCDLKGWALAVGRRAGPRKARVALARKLAVVLHRMLRDRTNFIAHKGAPALAA